MNAACMDFRARLAKALGAQGGPVGPQIAWHEHVLTCGDCRALLDAEEALEELLESLPRPSLPPELARRVLERLQPTRAERALDRLLDDALGASSQDAPQPPAKLAESMLARLKDEREAERKRRVEEPRLDALLDRLPAPVAPRGLAKRVLAGLADERREHRIEAAPRAAISRARTSELASSQRAPLRLVRPLLAAAALAGLIGAGAWFWSRNEFAPRREDFVRSDPTPGAESPRTSAGLDERASAPQPIERVDAARPSTDALEPDPELLAQLELLESWEVLTDESLDFEFAGIDESTLLGLKTDATLAIPATNEEAPANDDAKPGEEKG